MVTRRCQKYRTAKDYADAPQAELENAISPRAFIANKTKAFGARCA